MPVLHLILRDPAWPDLAGRRELDVIHVTTPIEVTGLPGGMDSGATSVAFRIDLPDGRVVIAETSLALLVATVAGIRAKWPSPPGVGENAP